ncbi:HPP family protein [Undibacterium terreum]|uniref:Membrane protein n=1 Tax=Undibacterium terreum TaxID=1224302 RepID=A0A916U666_9BURK|nr:HPP family protein [Undibacterium terreum]GGC60153.1 membrane protein [Undibacterium terreum]
MKEPLLQWLHSFLPSASPVNRFERMRACAGALFGMVLTAIVSYMLLGRDPAAIWLIAPMGASAVLLFAVPASPLAQPWSIIGGNFLSAIIGVACAKVFKDPAIAASIAVALSIAAMFTARCLHPPSGAVALTAVLGGPVIHALGFQFVLVPVAVNSLLMVLTAIFFNNTTGRRYPHPQQLEHKNKHETSNAVPTNRLGFTPEDLDAALRKYNQVLDVSRDDLEAILLQTEMLAHQRRFGAVSCGEIMSSELITAEFATPLEEAWQLMWQHRLHALPIIDRTRRVLGIVTTDSFLRHAQLQNHAETGSKLANFIRRTRHTHSTKPEVAGQIMTTEIQTVHVSKPIVELVPLMSDQEMHQLLIVDDQNKLLGMITQSDMIAALFEAGLEKA